jgi:hypothetical protein
MLRKEMDIRNHASREKDYGRDGTNCQKSDIRVGEIEKWMEFKEFNELESVLID